MVNERAWAARVKDERFKPRPLLCGAVHAGLLTGCAGGVKRNVVTT